MISKEFNQVRKEFREFTDFESYNQSVGSYYLMPFNFHRITKDREVLVNEIGDYILAPSGTFEKIVTRKLSKEDDKVIYQDLISNYFISEQKYSPNIDVIATRYRTKKLFLENFTGLHIFVISLRCEHTCSYCQM